MAIKFSESIDHQHFQLLGVRFENLAAPPAGPSEGWSYYDTVLHQWGYYNGSTWIYGTTITLASPGGTITIGGTGTNPTIDVAKVLDHTWITDFDTQVRTSRLDQMAAPTVDVSANNHKLTNISDASNPLDAVNLRTLQAVTTGEMESREVNYATAAALSAYAYANGTAGVGATITANANGALTVDGQNPAVNDRVLVQNGAANTDNGIYVVTQAGDGTHPFVLTRAGDMNTANDFGPGILVAVKAPTGETAGTANNNKVFLSAAKMTGFVVGTDSITFSLVGSAYVADETTLHLSGNTFSLIGPVAVATGGTGATTAGGARTNLSAAGFASGLVGTGAATDIDFAHGLNLSHKDACVVQVVDQTTFDMEVTRWTGKDVNTVTVHFGTAPAASAKRVNVVGL